MRGDPRRPYCVAVVDVQGTQPRGRNEYDAELLASRQLVLYDMAVVDGADVTDKPWHERLKLLRAAPTPQLFGFKCAKKTFYAANEARTALETSPWLYDGLMLHLPDRTYKWKEQHTVDVVRRNVVWECYWDRHDGDKLVKIKQRVDKVHGNAPRTVAETKQAHDDNILLQELYDAFSN
jgi:hypothetical protein